MFCVLDEATAFCQSLMGLHVQFASSMWLILLSVYRLMKNSSVAHRNWAGLLTGLLIGACLLSCDRTRTITGSGDPPNIQSVAAAPNTIFVGESSLITVVASDPAGGELTYEWDAGLGEIIGQGAEVFYTAQWCCVGRNSIIVRVINEGGGVAVASVLVTSRAPE